MYLFYSALLGLLLLLSLPWWALQAALHGKYRAGLSERLGFIPTRLQAPGDETTLVWVHAVSVGEVLAIAGIVEQLKHARPGLRVVVSTTTLTGQKLAQQRFGDQNVFFFPLDFAICIRPYIRALRPDMVVLAETEFWPNFLRLARDSGARVAVVNARISDRSLPRYRRWRGLLSDVLANVDLFCAQTEEDARRLREIGALAERVTVAGNLKFDAAPPGRSSLVEEMRTAIRHGGATPVIVCGSTVEGEEAAAMREFFSYRRERQPKALLVVAPRHPERFESVATDAKEASLPLVRRSGWNGEPLTGGVFLLDSIGELAAVYELADVAFVGGSMVPRGGHNILEPAFFGKATMVGPFTENFRDVVEQFELGTAIVVAGDFAALFDLADDRQRAAELGRRARAVLQQNQGATQRTLQPLLGLLPAAAQEQRA
jgi:3-deoxy-D-manno-octulosonic-acid transferase